jgi:hypothetical protein
MIKFAETSCPNIRTLRGPITSNCSPKASHFVLELLGIENLIGPPAKHSKPEGHACGYSAERAHPSFPPCFLIRARQLILRHFLHSHCFRSSLIATGDITTVDSQPNNL